MLRVATGFHMGLHLVELQVGLPVRRARPARRHDENHRKADHDDGAETQGWRSVLPATASAAFR
jgi:hypothetical protein